MTCYPKASKAERVGHWLGKTYRGLSRQEQRMRLWLVAHGLSEVCSKIFVWSVRFGVVALLLSISILLAGLVAGVVLAARVVSRIDLSYQVPDREWRDGDQGYGYYEHGVRTDFGRLFDDDGEL